MKRWRKSLIKSTVIWDVIQYIKLNNFKRKWVRANKHNETIPNNQFDINTVEVGNYSYGELNIVSFNNKSRLKIGNYVSIAQNVTFLLDVEHYTNHISTFPFKVKVLESVKDEAHSKGDIVIEDDVWIGFGATILSGVHIGKGAIVAAGAVVTEDIPAYSIVGGIPAKLIRGRFDTELCNTIGKIDYSKLTYEKIQENIEYLYRELTKDEAERIINILNVK